MILTSSIWLKLVGFGVGSGNVLHSFFCGCNDVQTFFCFYNGLSCKGELE